MRIPVPEVTELDSLSIRKLNPEGLRGTGQKPLCIDLFCGLGGWAEGFLAEGYDVIGFDIERRPYPGQLVLQDVLTLQGSQFRDATVIVASPPCQFFSRMAMPFKCPWNHAEFERRRDLALALFRACFHIAQQARVPLIVENVVGAQKWVGRASWHFGSYYLWGNLPALMPHTSVRKVPVYSDPRRNGGRPVHLTSPAENNNGLKFGGGWWHDATNNLIRKCGNKSSARKQASAEIAKIPFDLANHIARVYAPVQSPVSPQELMFSSQGGK